MMEEFLCKGEECVDRFVLPNQKCCIREGTFSWMCVDSEGENREESRKPVWKGGETLALYEFSLSYT